MTIDDCTLSIINNYIEATGLGEARRLSLTPADFLLFRQQAIEECKNTAPTAPVVYSPEPVRTPKESFFTPEKEPERKPEPVSPPPTKTYTPESSSFEEEYEEEEESGMATMLRSVPG